MQSIESGTIDNITMLRKYRDFIVWMMFEALVSAENSREDRRKETMIFFLMFMEMELRYQKEMRRHESNLFKWQAGFVLALAVIGLMSVHWLRGWFG